MFENNSVEIVKAVKRGQMYYIHKTPAYEGSREIQMKSGRPGIIVSRNEDNINSGTVMVVYLTSWKANRLIRDTQFSITSGRVSGSVVKCEQIDTVDKNCIGDFICDVSEEYMESLDKKLLLSLGIESYKDEESEVNCLKKELKECKDKLREVTACAGKNYKNEAEKYKNLYVHLVRTLAGKEI